MDCSKTGWLSPTGEMFYCNAYNHLKLAKEIASKYIKYKDPKMLTTPDDYIMEYGWVHITNGVNGEYSIYWDDRWRLTPEQVRFLIDNHYFVQGGYNVL